MPTIGHVFSSRKHFFLQRTLDLEAAFCAHGFLSLCFCLPPETVSSFLHRTRVLGDASLHFTHSPIIQSSERACAFKIVTPNTTQNWYCLDSPLRLLLLLSLLLYGPTTYLRQWWGGVSRRPEKTRECAKWRARFLNFRLEKTRDHGN